MHNRKTINDKALLDLDVSINLLSCSFYKQLGLGEFKPTKAILELASRSIKLPKGKIEDMLIMVSEFIFTLDFIILET